MDSSEAQALVTDTHSRSTDSTVPRFFCHVVTRSLK
jgi:hypothetical protein